MLQPGTESFQDVESGAGQLHPALEVDDVQRFTQLPVGGGGKVKLFRFTPCPHRYVVLFSFTDGYGGVGDIGHLQQQFKDFLQLHANEKKSELFITAAVDSLLQRGLKKLKVLTTDDNWFGVTYPEDKPIAQESITKLIEQGVYPEKLW